MNCGVGEDSWESLGLQGDPVYPKGNQSWIFIGGTDAEAETPILWPPDAKNWLIWKDPDARKDWRQEEKGMTEHEMVDGITNSRDMNLSKPWELVMDRKVCRAAVHGVAKSRTLLSDWTELNSFFTMLSLLPLMPATAKLLQSCPTLWDPPGSPSLGFFMQEHWSGLPFPSPMHESEKWKSSRSIVSDLQRPHGLQPTRLLRPWDFPGKSTGVGCLCLLCINACLCSILKRYLYGLWACTQTHSSLTGVHQLLSQDIIKFLCRLAEALTTAEPSEMSFTITPVCFHPYWYVYSRTHSANGKFT